MATTAHGVMALPAKPYGNLNKAPAAYSVALAFTFTLGFVLKGTLPIAPRVSWTLRPVHDMSDVDQMRAHLNVLLKKISSKLDMAVYHEVEP